MKPRRITTPLTEEVRRSLHAGDELLLSGTIYTARDIVHARLAALLAKGEKLPAFLRAAVLYYCGPTDTPRGKVIGSCGPTTAGRMDAFTPALLKAGIVGLIGKGKRSDDVRAAIRREQAVYLLATGGLGALLASKVKEASVVLYPELGPEAVHRLVVEDFPLIVGIDTRGKDCYDETH